MFVQGNFVAEAYKMTMESRVVMADVFRTWGEVKADQDVFAVMTGGNLYPSADVVENVRHAAKELQNLANDFRAAMPRETELAGKLELDANALSAKADTLQAMAEEQIPIGSGWDHLFDSASRDVENAFGALNAKLNRKLGK